ncbi:hypothetical protein PZA11_001173 [Diplocarpon coronariae]|uniref:Uncharacterized protein n=1 Tax=Diplocarpon coronariae TaxID=2795749 RepID=A0A218Z7W4_9HELO|nr:hypothetical protein JHW43_004421 [Diplocarpon mali]OWP03266.1 hypothetical protein B2J93_2998 [Marssonina coronariae]
MASSQSLSSSLSKLSINPPSSKPARSSKKPRPVSESWDDDDGSETETEAENENPLSPQQSHPSAPPPTPISPSTPLPSSSDDYNNAPFVHPYGFAESSRGESERERERGGVRPEKTDAVAKRMIAGALGVKAPKKTEEGRAYERAVRENELRRRKEEKEKEARAREEAEKAKAAIWED